MEENALLNVEQPTHSFDSPMNSSCPDQTRTDEVSEDNSGSTFGKFKDATSLLSAYSALEAEFTRKSQRLSEALKLIDEQNAKENTVQRDLAQGIDKGPIEQLGSNVSAENKSTSTGSKEWRNKVENFLSDKPEAREFTRGIVNALRANPELKNMKNGLDIAYKMTVAEQMVKPADLIRDQKFISEHVMTNEDIKSAIIQEYLGNAKNSSPKIPSTIQGSSRYVPASKSQSSPSTISGAGKIFEAMLNGK